MCGEQVLRADAGRSQEAEQSLLTEFTNAAACRVCRAENHQRAASDVALSDAVVGRC